MIFYVVNEIVNKIPGAGSLDPEFSNDLHRADNLATSKHVAEGDPSFLFPCALN